MFFQRSAVRSSSALALAGSESSAASAGSVENAMTSSPGGKAAAKQGSSPGPLSPYARPASQASSSQVQRSGCREKAALTPPPSQRGEEAAKRPFSNRAVT